MNEAANEVENKLALAILKLLAQAGDGSKYIGLPVGIFNDEAEQQAVERCTFNGWLQLIDVRPVAGKEGIFRCFAITEQGMAHRKIVEEFFATPALPPQ